jgi:hypothetical protein
MQFDMIVKKDLESYFVATVPALPGCHTQVKSLDKLIERIKEAIEIGRDLGQEVTTVFRTTWTEERPLFQFIPVKPLDPASWQASFAMSSSQELNSKTFSDELKC